MLLAWSLAVENLPTEKLQVNAEFGCFGRSLGRHCGFDGVQHIILYGLRFVVSIRCCIYFHSFPGRLFS